MTRITLPQVVEQLQTHYGQQAALLAAVGDDLVGERRLPGR
jgi:hypothetical protein